MAKQIKKKTRVKLGSKTKLNKASKNSLRAGSSGASMSLAAEAFRLKPDDIVFETEESCPGNSFYGTAACLYGPVKIGKTTLAAQLDNVYFLATEIGFNWVKSRKTYIPNWATFRKFVETMEAHPELAATVNMWVIDTVSNLSKFCSQYTCGREKIAHPSEGEWGAGWEAIQDEFMHWIVRLGMLGPGVLFIAHEKEREIISHSMRITKRGPDLVKSHYTIINNMCDLILRMDFAPRARRKQNKEAGKVTVERCIFTKPEETIEAGDRTGSLPDKIYFDTEKEAAKIIVNSFKMKGEK